MLFDLIIVGGGAAGCAMAGRLSEDGRLNVLLIEAGSSDRHGLTKIPALMSAAMQNPDFDWLYRAEPDPSLGGRADIWPLGKCLGGGTAINGMTFTRGHRADYDRWAQEGATGWDYESVLPYFKRLETNERGADDYRGGAGPLNVAEGRARSPLTSDWVDAAIDCGLERSPDLNGAKAEGVDYVQVTQKNGMRHSAAAAYVDPALKRKNVTVITDAEVTKIRFDGKRAVGIDYVQHRQHYSHDARLGILVCAGAVNTPRLLMLSGIGPAMHLEELGIEVVQDLPGVGQNLQERPGIVLVHDVNAHTLHTDAQGFGAITQMLNFALTRQGVYTTSIGHAQAIVRTPSAASGMANVQLLFAPFAFEVDEHERLKVRKLASVSTFVTLCRPAARGKVRLASSDPLAPPIIELPLLEHDTDVRQLAEGLEVARNIASRPSFARYVTGEVSPGLVASNLEGLSVHVRKHAHPAYNPAGTCKMGNDPMAVVDPQLRVRGVEGLWVADASIVPSLPSGGLAATAMMIGEKGADLVQAALAA